MDNIKQRHHYIPKFYLNGFCDINGQIWTYDKLCPDNVFSNSPTNTAVINKLYHLTGDQIDVDINAIEEILAKWIEGPASLPLKNLISKKFPNMEDKMHLSNYFGLLMVRTPYYIQHLEMILNKYFDFDNKANTQASYKENFLADYRAFDPNLSELDIENIRNSILKKEVHLKVHRDFLLKKMLTVGEIISKILYNMNWGLIETDKINHPFIISDNTFNVINPNIPRPGFYSPGLGLPDTTIFIPISSELCLLLINNPGFRNGTVYHHGVPLYSSVGNKINLNHLVKTINKYTFIMSHKYVFACSNSEKLKRCFNNLLIKMSKK